MTLIYEYNFVKVELSTWSSKPKEDYQDIINKYASNGWRFVQIFAPSIKGYDYRRIRDELVNRGKKVKS